MYYWRTSLSLSTQERAFLRQHNVRRLYVRYFDVVPTDDEGNQPNATITFDDSLPKGVEIVPCAATIRSWPRGSSNVSGR